MVPRLGEDEDFQFRKIDRGKDSFVFNSTFRNQIKKKTRKSQLSFDID